MTCIVEVVNLSGTCLCATVSGDVVNISGQSVNVNLSGLTINISGAIVQISGQAVTTSVSGDIVQISGQAVTTSVSGDIVLISGQAVVTDSGSVTSVSGNIIVTSVSGNLVTIMGSQLVPAEQDTIVNSLVSIGHPHDDIHEGKSYIVSDLVRVTGANSFQKYLVRTSTTVTHMLLSVTGTAGNIVKWIESPTVTSTGIPLTTINHSRVSGVSSVTTVFGSGSNYTSGTGTVLQIEQIGAPNVGGNRFGGTSSQDRNENEWNLKTSNAVYALEIMSLVGTDNDISSQFRWYEM